MLISYNADLLPKVRMLGQIRYNEPWLHFSRCINEWVLYVIRDGNLYLQEDGVRYHLSAGDFFLLEPGLPHEGYQKAVCDYYYVHFTHPDMHRAADDRQAMALLAEKRRQSLVGYNLDACDPTAPETCLPKQFHLTGGEFKSQLHAAVECYDSREDDYKRRASAPAAQLSASDGARASACKKQRTGTEDPKVRRDRGAASALSESELY